MVESARVRELESQRHAIAHDAKRLMLRAVSSERPPTSAEQVDLDELRQQQDRIEREIQAVFDAP